MTKLNLTVERWAAVQPDAFLTGSIVQARNVLEMALHDIALLAADRDRIERNRDMWKGQVERQAERLTETHAALLFYADPFAWKKLHDPENDVQVPDFYSETSFGDTALAIVSSDGSGA